MANAIVGLTSPLNKNTKASPTKSWLAIAGAAIGVISGLSARRKARAQQRAAQEELEASRKAWEGMEFTNPYAGIQNPYANLENVYEEMQVDTRAADYMKRQQQQQQADIMQGLRGAAGASGVAGLAQAVSNVGTQQAAATGAVLSQQEQLARTAKLGEASRLQQLRTSGDFQADMLRRKGEQLVTAQEAQRASQLYGLSMDQKMAANAALQAANQQIWSSVGQGISGFAGMYGTGGTRAGMWGQDLGTFQTGMRNLRHGDPWNYQGAGPFLRSY